MRVERDAGRHQISIIGRRNSLFGTGRVMSQIKMQAFFRPSAKAPKGLAEMGWSSA